MGVLGISFVYVRSWQTCERIDPLTSLMV
jgi:hypothetical protein